VYVAQMAEGKNSYKILYVKFIKEGLSILLAGTQKTGMNLAIGN